MRIQDKLMPYLEYCEYRKELDKKTLKAYRIDLRHGAARPATLPCPPAR